MWDEGVSHATPDFALDFQKSVNRRFTKYLSGLKNSCLW